MNEDAGPDFVVMDKLRILKYRYNSFRGKVVNAACYLVSAVDYFADAGNVKSQDFRQCLLILSLACLVLNTI